MIDGYLVCDVGEMMLTWPSVSIRWTGDPVVAGLHGMVYQTRIYYICMYLGRSSCEGGSVRRDGRQ